MLVGEVLRFMIMLSVHSLVERVNRKVWSRIRA